MENREISVLMMENMNHLSNLIKIVNDERNSSEKILTERQFFALVSIRKHKKIELKNLSKDLYVSTSSLCILLNKLVEQEYVYREEDTKDRRNTFYCISEKGDRIVKAEIDKFLGIIGTKVNKLDINQKEKLFNCLSEVNPMIKKLF
ncbi:MarR family transcriptional regulator [Romboutsia sedimentorum]|uniref:MarR family transcriptional regulator n=1 Tax=Romboutsia sedimentorum TaxID=1368474 RepID=A0ABT7E8L4_9FIRM|nr:MarR family transcriptional regulator [Romboutsia sedimentorum]MDK2563265.1 MarR family transcriptional regulator [Romboutsia sedimentorum]